jgi:Family of unknown function (DUF5572)
MNDSTRQEGVIGGPETSQSSYTTPQLNDADKEAIFSSLSKYDFAQDEEYIAGLRSILGPSASDYYTTPSGSVSTSASTSAQHQPQPHLPSSVSQSDQTVAASSTPQPQSQPSQLSQPRTTIQPPHPENDFLILQAQCFYFSRKHHLSTPIDPVAYQTWLDARASRLAGSRGVVGEGAVLSGADTAATASSDRGGEGGAECVLGSLTSTSGDVVGTRTDGEGDRAIDHVQPQEPPPYPTSFAAVVDLITRNIPVPGIEEIPTTVLERGSSKSDQASRRRKPWEKDEVDEGAKAEQRGSEGEVAGSDGGRDTVNGYLATGEGVVKILQPNAIADSGLIAKE